MKILGKLIVIVLVLALIAGALFVFAFDGIDRIKISQLCADFAVACQENDTDAIMDCLDSDITEQINETSDMVDAFSDWLYSVSGYDLNYMLDKVDQYIQSSGMKDSVEYYLSSAEFGLADIQVDGNTGKVTASATYEEDGASVTRDFIIKCTKKDGQWYISGIDDSSDD